MGTHKLVLLPISAHIEIRNVRILNGFVDEKLFPTIKHPIVIDVLDFDISLLFFHDGVEEGHLAALE